MFSLSSFDLSVLYSFEGGFAGFHSSTSHLQAVHVAMNSADPEFETENIPTEGAFPLLPISAYRKYEEIMDSLPTPMILSCRSSARASAILAAYKAVKQGLSSQQIMHFAHQHSKANSPYPSFLSHHISLFFLLFRYEVLRE